MELQNIVLLVRWDFSDKTAAQIKKQNMEASMNKESEYEASLHIKISLKEL